MDIKKNTCWNRINDIHPPYNQRIRVKFEKDGIGGAIVDDWTSTGILRNGRWSIKQPYVGSFNGNYTPTHWKFLEN